MPTNLLSPSAVHIDGWLGARIDANESHRLLARRHRAAPGRISQEAGQPPVDRRARRQVDARRHARLGLLGRSRLREKLDRVAAELIHCQEPDGYLGTYVPEQRFGLFPDADWDVWSHKYNLIGLLTYYQYTGDKAALDACRKMADLLIATFPAKKSILAAGTHMGMAATSVLEPIVLLYRATGDPRYLQFARYIVKSWDEPNGPRIADSLLTRETASTRRPTARPTRCFPTSSDSASWPGRPATANGCRPRQTPGRTSSTTGCTSPGSASAFEHSMATTSCPTRANNSICETCVTTTWIQLNLQLLRLTGEAKYGDELERSFYNHLAAAQHPRGDDWCYYTALEGRKPYDKGITCCHSSGPRGMALAPQAAYLRGHAGGDVLLVNTLETSQATLELGGRKVTVEQKSEFPRQGHATITLRSAAAAPFAVKIRLPGLGGAGGDSGCRREAQGRFGRLDRSALAGLEKRRPDHRRFPSRTEADSRRIRQRRACGPGLGTVRAGLRPRK